MRFCYFSILILFCFSSVSQVSLVLQPDTSTSKDVVVWDYLPNTNMSNTTEFTIYSWTYGGTPTTRRTYIDFDLSSIPQNSIIQDSKLYLYNYSSSTSTNGSHSQLTGSNEMKLNRVTSSWDDNTITWNNQPQISLLNQVITGVSTGPHQDYEIDVTQLVQDMVNNPNQSFGICMRLVTEQIYRSLIFGSSDITDSLRRPKLIIDYFDQYTYQIDTCDYYSWSQNGETYTTSGIYFDTIMSSTGADSIISLDLTINNSSTNFIEENVCDTFVWIATGDTLTDSGEYVEYLTSSFGCDSVVYLTLNVSESFYDTVYESTCNEYYWSVTNLYYSNTGTYDAYLTSADGCDSIISLDLEIFDFYFISQPIDFLVDLGQTAIFMTETSIPNANYQWQANSGSGFVNLIDSGQYSGTSTNQITITACTISNNQQQFRCISMFQNCSDTSQTALLQIQNIGISEYFYDEINLNIYPNPTGNLVRINSEVKINHINIYDALGNNLRYIKANSSNISVDVSLFTDGVYYVEILTVNQVIRKPFMISR